MIKKKPPSIQETVNRLQASLLDTHELQAQQQLLQETIQALQVLQMDQETEPAPAGAPGASGDTAGDPGAPGGSGAHAAVLGQAPDVAEALSGRVKVLRQRSSDAVVAHGSRAPGERGRRPHSVSRRDAAATDTGRTRASFLSCAASLKRLQRSSSIAGETRYKAAVEDGHHPGTPGARLDNRRRMQHDIPETPKKPVTRPGDI